MIGRNVAATIVAKMSRTALISMLAIVLFGLVVRGWGLERLGLVHFDEGIYATAAAGLLDGSIDPGLIAYAPPVYPFLASLAFRLLGPSDTAAILVSIGIGTATIPCLGWLANSAGDRRAGLVSAGLAAVWGGQVAFSRMALTDASFLFCWTLGLIASARLLDRPTIGRTLLAGLAIGLAQNTKYNGWLLGVVLAAAALPSGKDRRRRIAAVVAAGLLGGLLYLPWFRFVDDHGGYRSLLRHQAGYVLGWTAWLRDWRIQLDQVEALSGLPDWGPAGRFAIASAVLACLLVPLPDRFRRVARWVAAVGLMLAPSVAWWLGLMAVPVGLTHARPARRVLAWSWLVLAILTPLYHPYARLWLPIQATSLVLAAVLIVEEGPAGKLGRSWRVAAAVGCLAFVGLVGRGRPLPDLLGPTDSLRAACLEASAEVLKNPDRVPTLARPSALFYLASRVPIARLADAESARSVRAFGPSGWLLIDEAQWRQDRSHGQPIDPGRWQVAGRWPTPLSPAAWLDADPAAASTASNVRDASLILYRSAPPKAGPRP